MNNAKGSREVEMTFPDGTREGLLVTALGPNLYRLEESPVLGEARYHDIVETESEADGNLRFVRVAIPSGLKTNSWVLPKSIVESSALSALLDNVVAIGGHWEKLFGGVLLVHLPPAESNRFVREMENLISGPGQ